MGAFKVACFGLLFFVAACANGTLTPQDQAIIVQDAGVAIAQYAAAPNADHALAGKLVAAYDVAVAAVKAEMATPNDTAVQQSAVAAISALTALVTQMSVAP